jgi:hypothetical protein
MPSSTIATFIATFIAALLGSLGNLQVLLVRLQFRPVSLDGLLGFRGVLMIDFRGFERLLVGLKLLLVRLNGLIAYWDARIGCQGDAGKQSRNKNGEKFVHDVSFQ